VFLSSNDKIEIKSFNIKVHQKGVIKDIKCLSNETLLHCFEANGIKALSKCRSGECGFCHSKLISGEVTIPENQDRRRLADDIYGYIHPCCSYPVSDIEIEIN
jgi:ferredoxin